MQISGGCNEDCKGRESSEYQKYGQKHSYGNTSDAKVNEDIKHAKIRLIDEDGKQLGIMSSADALIIAAEHDVDLVEIPSTVNPPVCRLMDFGKYKFDQSKKEKDAKRAQKQMETKEIRMSAQIDTNDLQNKIAAINKFLEAGHKVKVSIRFRGREILYPEYGVKVLTKVTEQCSEFGKQERSPKLDGKFLSMLLVPARKKK